MSLSYLLLEPWQSGPVLGVQEVTTPGEEATDVHRILRKLVAAHRARAFFDPPANGTLTRIVGAI